MTKLATFQDPMFHDEDRAREALEAELWPNGVICRHCGNSDPEKIAKMQGKSHRPGLYYCHECNGQFTVTVGTVLERSKVPLTKWLMAAHMVNSGKNGVSAHEIHRTLGVTYKTAWFMMHRLREAMQETNPTPMGGEGKSIQADETYYGNSKRAKSYRKGHSHKASIVALVEPQGRARAFHVKKADSKTVREILVTNAHRSSELNTDESALYRKVGPEFAKHKTVMRGSPGWEGFYVGKDGATTNAAENFFGNFKRSMKGTYRFCSEQHLQRYLNEFQFRHNHRTKLGFNDGERTAAALKGIEGKRLTYRPTN
ncbi:MAG: IS1595 family transposase [Xanthobacteraceae bacterium]